MDDNLEETRSENSGQVKNQEFGDPELNSEPEVPVIPSSEPEHEPAATPAYNTAIPRKRNPKRLLYLIAAVLVILILFFGVKKLIGGSKSPAPTPTPVAVETSTPTPTESASPTATSSPTPNPVDKATGLDRSNLSVAIQNGSGTPGVAGTASDLLKGLGYNVTSTGNADNFGFTDVTVKVKATKKNYLPLLIKDLSSKYTIGASSSDLSASSSADALVIVGK
ncbi:MAG TPA: LytR C-terminal domain-containing protein [Patescibacteria group bacterium]|nr:LytR C-terminal domain-containing protein [Patescibacteria group bacterium]